MERLIEQDNFAGMTINERLFVAGLMDSFDKAVTENDREGVISILKKVNLNSETIEANLRSIFKD
jgi:hypothetical protein